MISTVIAFLLKGGFRGTAQSVVSFFDRKADRKLSQHHVDAKVKTAKLQAQVDEAGIRAADNKEKMSHPAFWWFLGLFIVPLGVWWAAVLMDSIPYIRDIFGDQDVYDLPNEHMREWAGMMIKWIFFLGSGVGAIKVSRK